VCLTDSDKDLAKVNKGSLLYGELLPRGANKVRYFSSGCCFSLLKALLHYDDFFVASIFFFFHLGCTCTSLQALGSKHLNARTATTLFDMGMGTGKIPIQAFIQYRNLKYVYGVELSQGRYKYVQTYIRCLCFAPEFYS
jgi:hypothetical protein